MAMKYSQNLMEKYDEVKDEVWLTEQQYLNVTKRLMNIYQGSIRALNFFAHNRGEKMNLKLNTSYNDMLESMEREFQELHNGQSRTFYIFQEYKRIGKKALEKNGETIDLFESEGYIRTGGEMGSVFGKKTKKRYRVDLENGDAYDSEDYINSNNPTIIGKFDIEDGVIILRNGDIIELQVIQEN